MSIVRHSPMLIPNIVMMDTERTTLRKALRRPRVNVFMPTTLGQLAEARLKRAMIDERASISMADTQTKKLGLTAAEAHRRLLKNGYNEIVKQRRFGGELGLLAHFKKTE